MRYFTLSFTLILLLFVGCGLVGCGRGNTSAGQASNAKANIRTITISRQALDNGLSDTLQLGRMHQGEVIATNIRLVNGDSLPMVILREATSCGCTKATYSRKPIAAGTSFADGLADETYGVLFRTFGHSSEDIYRCRGGIVLLIW